ncbi:ABC transporter permease [Halobacillus litoralis]|uniref:Transport permease protein n=1 Tax=Halobacillus litoralis TaxID=45668 RepID=A0A845E3B9_9BACI|nr:ABC transporter permease [Halobacillus litoralis]MYL20757.1 ABC transporter permease [Halobacillus litoralis]
MNKMITSHVKADLKLFMRDPMAMGFTFILPAVLFVIFGNIFGNESYGGVEYFQLYISAMVAIMILNIGLFTIGLQLVVDREKGVLRRLKGTPLRPWVMFTSILMKALIATFVGAVEIMLIAYFVFDAPITDHLFSYAITLVIVTICFCSFSLIITSFAKTIGAGLGMAFVLMYIMLFLSGVTIPLEIYPDTVQTIAKFIPLYYVHDALQLVWRGAFSFSDMTDIAFLILFAVFSLLLSNRYFRWE